MVYLINYVEITALSIKEKQISFGYYLLKAILYSITFNFLIR